MAIPTDPKSGRLRLQGTRAALIINPCSARNRWTRDPKLRGFLTRRFPGRVYDEARNKGETVALARRLSLENDLLVGAGGDGTLADIMQGIFDAGRQNDVVLGILPLGSGNALRKTLQIPKAVKAAFRVLRKGLPRPIDLIEVGGRVASFVSIGATGSVTHKKSKAAVPGLLGHLLAARILFTHPRDIMEIEIIDGVEDKGRRFLRKTLSLKLFDVIINKTNHFGYSWQIAPKARIDDGYLDVTLFDNRAFSYLLYFPLIYLGLYQKALKHFKARRVIVRGRELKVQYNGEILEETDEIELKVLPEALRVITPRPL